MEEEEGGLLDQEDLLSGSCDDLQGSSRALMGVGGGYPFIPLPPPSSHTPSVPGSSEGSF